MKFPVFKPVLLPLTHVLEIFKCVSTILKTNMQIFFV